MLAFAALTASFGLNFASHFLLPVSADLIFWAHSTGLLLVTASFFFDPHSRLRAISILAIVAFLFAKDHLLLAIQSLLITILVLELAYTTKHRDLIPFGAGFLLATTAEFFYYLENIKGFENIALAGSFLYIFAAICLFYWLWGYLVIRFNLKKKLSG